MLLIPVPNGSASHLDRHGSDVVPLYTFLVARGWEGPTPVRLGVAPETEPSTSWWTAVSASAQFNGRPAELYLRWRDS